MLRDRSRESVILISQVLSDCGGKPNVSVARPIRFMREQRIAWDDTSTYPIINSISRDDETGHGPLSASPPPIPCRLTNPERLCSVPHKGGAKA
jgi:hypothetical protein